MKIKVSKYIRKTIVIWVFILNAHFKNYNYYLLISFGFVCTKNSRIMFLKTWAFAPKIAKYTVKYARKNQIYFF